MLDFLILSCLSKFLRCGPCLARLSIASAIPVQPFEVKKSHHHQRCFSARRQMDQHLKSRPVVELARLIVLTIVCTIKTARVVLSARLIFVCIIGTERVIFPNWSQLGLGLTTRN